MYSVNGADAVHQMRMFSIAIHVMCLLTSASCSVSGVDATHVRRKKDLALYKKSKMSYLVNKQLDCYQTSKEETSAQTPHHQTVVYLNGVNDC